MPYPYDPELAAALALMAEVDLSDLSAARAAQAREVAAHVAAADTTGVEIAQLHAPGPGGAPDVPLRTYRPDSARGAALPVLFSVHGGGFVLGSPDVDHETNLRLCREPGVVAVSPDYRLAPEHPYPAALEATASRASCYWRRTPPSCACGRIGSRSAATAPEPGSPRP
jgi:acetyl esterase